MNREMIQRELGRIEGIGLGLGGSAGHALQMASDRIGKAIDQAEASESEGCDMRDLQPGVDVALRAIHPEQYTTGETKELTEQLVGYYRDHANGKAMSLRRICNDCIRAAGLIDYLLEEREQRQFRELAENP